jgi:hypothetical protein
MIQTHQGYFQADGRLILNDALVKIPSNVEVTVFWNEEEVIEAKSTAQEGLTRQQTAAKKFLEGVERITANGLSAETSEAFESLERGDFKFRMEDRLS